MLKTERLGNNGELIRSIGSRILNVIKIVGGGTRELFLGKSYSDQILDQAKQDCIRLCYECGIYRR